MVNAVRVHAFGIRGHAYDPKSDRIRLIFDGEEGSVIDFSILRSLTPIMCVAISSAASQAPSEAAQIDQFSQPLMFDRLRMTESLEGDVLAFRNADGAWLYMTPTADLREDLRKALERLDDMKLA